MGHVAPERPCGCGGGGGGSNDCSCFVKPQISTSGPTYNVSLTDRIIKLLSGGVSVNLPSGATQDNFFMVKDFDGNASASPSTVFPPIGHTIDGQSSLLIDVDMMCMTIAFDGNNKWFVV